MVSHDQGQTWLPLGTPKDEQVLTAGISVWKNYDLRKFGKEALYRMDPVTEICEPKKDSAKKCEPKKKA
jgi:hypothetical protein